MFVRYFLILVFITIFSTIAATQTNKIYKWTDEAGVTHLSQYPPKEKASNTSVEALQVTIPIVEPTQEQNSKDRLAKINKYFEEKEEAKKQQLENSNTEQVNKENCELARSNLALYQSGQRLRTRSDQDSEPQILTEAERIKRIERSEKNIQSYC